MDLSLTTKWRVFSGYEGVRPGNSKHSNGRLVWSVSPGEWTVLEPRPEPDQPEHDQPEHDQVVDLTHVRAMFRVTGKDGPGLLAKLCALDLGDDMFPNGAAARTLVAGVATELVRDDEGEVRSYLVLPSRSFGRYILDVIRDAGEEFGLQQLPVAHGATR
ncbi:MAG: hypothetical protein Q8Q52_06350 [Acidimicrobiia bacterium]|nr:hypothetical protein [Acidimicrobiia bacterium]